MKGMLFPLIALLMCILPSQSRDVDGIDRSSISEVAISAPNFIGTNTLQDSSKKNNSGLNYIAQTFIPVVMIADFSYQEANFRHYLSTYNFTRAKEYFLLI